MIAQSFSSLLDIDKLIQTEREGAAEQRFSSLLDIDKLIPHILQNMGLAVLVLCWILINLY